MKRLITPVLLTLLLFGAMGLIATWLRPVKEARIDDVRVVHNQGNLELNFSVIDCFTPKMEEAIHSGVPTTFRFRVVLQKKRKLPLFRSALLDIGFEHTIKYDRLKDRFLVKLPEQPDTEVVIKDFEEAKRVMSRVKNLPVIPLWRLMDSGSYQLLVKAELSKLHLPLFFRYILFFISLWDFETDWEHVSLNF